MRTDPCHCGCHRYGTTTACADCRDRHMANENEFQVPFVNGSLTVYIPLDATTDSDSVKEAK